MSHSSTEAVGGMAIDSHPNGNARPHASIYGYSDDWVICKNDAKNTELKQMKKWEGYSTDFGLNFIILR